MKQRLTQERLPLFSLELTRSETRLRSSEEIVEHYRKRIAAHDLAQWIGVFDHLAHTRALAVGQIAPEIIGAKNVLFCFGITLPKPDALALRPRSIGICETSKGFVISFLQTPMPVANAILEEWTLEILDGPESR